MMLYFSSWSMPIFRTLLPLSVFMMGFAEIIAGLDTILKRSIHLWDEELQQRLYRGKLGSIAFGSGTGFLCGSFLYQEFGIFGGCSFIAIIGVVHLVLTVIYVRRFLDNQRTQNTQTAAVKQEGGDESNVSKTRSVSVYKFFTPFLLSTGAIMITTDFTVTPLYWEDVWGTHPVVCGLLLFIGEIAGFILLNILNSKPLRDCKITKQPALIVLAAFTGMLAVSTMAFSHLIQFGDDVWAFYADAVGTAVINVSNAMLHSSGIELMVL